MVEQESGTSPAVGELDRGVAFRETAAASVILLFAVSFTLVAFSFGEEARRLPLVVGFPLTIMAMINLVLVVRDQWLRPAGAGTAGGTTTADSRSESLAEAEDKATALRDAQATAASFEDTGEGLSFGAAVLTLVTVMALFMLLGLIPAAVLFVTGYVRFKGGESWSKAIGISGLLIVLFWLFNTLLNVRFYEGWLVAEDYIPYVLPF